MDQRTINSLRAAQNCLMEIGELVDQLDQTSGQMKAGTQQSTSSSQGYSQQMHAKLAQLEQLVAEAGHALEEAQPDQV